VKVRLDSQAGPWFKLYGIIAVTAGDVPAEFCIVTVTEAMDDKLPPTENDIENPNCDPVARDAGFAYQVWNIWLTS
jgi:hypothetical protein